MQHGVDPEQSLFAVHCTQALLTQYGLVAPHAAQVEPQCVATSHAEHAFESQ